MLNHGLAIATTACLAFAGAAAFFAAPDFASDGPASARAAGGTGDASMQPAIPENARIINSTVCIVQVTHASLQWSPVCAIANGDGAQGVGQGMHVEADCGGCHADPAPVPVGPAAPATPAEGDRRDGLASGDGSYVGWHNESHENHTTVNDNDTTVSDDDTTITRGDTCENTQESVCDQDHEETTQECSGSGDIVNVQVCNVNVEPVDDVTVNDAVDLNGTSATADPTDATATVAAIGG